MKLEKINQLFADTAYIRTGGSAEELKCAEYLKAQCAELGLEAHLEEFEVDMADMKKAVLIVDGKEIPCKGFKGSGSGEVEAPFYYKPNTDAYSLQECKGKIVMVDTGIGRWIYKDMLDNGAVGFISYDGNVFYADEDIDQRELRSYVSEGQKILGVNINAKKAVEIVKSGAKTAKIVLEQDEYKGKSHNVVLDLPGEVKETIVFTAHYDSTSLAQGAYDNMSGCVALLGIAEEFAKKPHRYGMRFVWCGSEERGLLGSKAYTAQHEEELKDIVMCINVDMIGCIMGDFLACCTSEEKLVHYIQYLGLIEGFGLRSYQDVYSSDSTPFADKGIPAVSFARMAPQRTAVVHLAYDTAAVMSAEQMAKDIDFINLFTDKMVNAKHCPVAKEIPDNMKTKLDNYLLRKRDGKEIKK